MAAGADGQPSVFISYARRSAAEDAAALHRTLTGVGVPTFLDTQDLAVGDRIPEEVFERLLGSRVVVVLADATYFTRRYCLEELATALAAYRALGRRGAGREEMEAALRPLVVALPAAGEQLGELDRLPHELRSTYWPPASQTGDLADLVRARLGGVEETIGRRLERLGELAQLRERLYEAILPADLPSRFRSAAASRSTRSRVCWPSTSTRGRNESGRALVDVGATSHVDSSARWSD